MPKASAREFHRKQWVSSKTKGPLRRPVKTTRILIAVGGPHTDCFRSQLRRLGFGQPQPGATPARLCEHTMWVASRPSEPELSTLVGTGTFYFGPTRRTPVGSN